MDKILDMEGVMDKTLEVVTQFDNNYQSNCPYDRARQSY